jgi:hypothetical protein
VNDQTAPQFPIIRTVAGSLGGRFLLVDWGTTAQLGTFIDNGNEALPIGERLEWENRNFQVDLTHPGERFGAAAMSTVNWGGSGAKNVEDTVLMANLLATAARIALDWDDDVTFGK